MIRDIVRIEQRTDSDCMRCCLAMVMGLPYEEVPDFVAEHGGEWLLRCSEWLQGRGCGLVRVPGYVFPLQQAFASSFMPVIITGATERGPDMHAIVKNGPDTHIDPHPSQAGIVDLYSVIVVAKMFNRGES